MSLELELVRYYLVLAEELHFTRAAERLFIAQPVLSRAIKRLEHGVGVELVSRTTRAVELTAAGRAFLPAARRLLEQAEEAAELARAAGRGEAGRLRVGFLPGTASELTARMVRRHRERLPKVKLVLKQGDFRDPSAGLRTGRADVALVCPPLGLGGLECVLLHEEPRVVALPADHPLAGRQWVSIDALLDEPWCGPLCNDPVWQDFWTAAEHRDGARPASLTEVATLDELLEFVAGGGGIGLTFASIERYYRRPGVVFVVVPDIAPYRMAIAYRRASGDLLIRGLLQTVRELDREPSSASV